MLGQVLARHLRVPGIVVLLALGVATGPEGLGWLHPSALGHGLADLVSFAVAIILFEGGLALDLRGLFRHGLAIRRLVTVGILITAVLASLAARGLLAWPWATSLLFGSLVVVTGPTVIQPILRRVRVLPRLATVLEAEGILGDAVGATLAVVTLEVLMAPPGDTLSQGALGLFFRLAFGSVGGLLAGITLAAVIRFERLLPEELRNVTALALLLGFYQACNALQTESGILAAIVAGLFVGNLKGQPLQRLREFKEELTVMLIGLLFVLLAADVRLADVRQLGLGGALVVAALIFVVRPVNVFVSTAGTGLSLRDQLFLSWLAPRGIVAAAVAAHFASVLSAAGRPGGRELQALVFLVIAVTVTVQGLSGGLVARLLRVALPKPTGWAVLGANGLSRLLATRLAPPAEVLLVDANHDSCAQGAKAGFQVFCGNPLEEEAFEAAHLGERGRFLALTPNEEVNFLFGRRVRESLRGAEIWVALRRDHPGIGTEMLAPARIHRLFDGKRNLNLWAVRAEQGLLAIERWQPPKDGATFPQDDKGEPSSDVLPLVVRRGESSLPVSDQWKPAAGDIVELAVRQGRQEPVAAAMTALGWSRAPEPAAEPAQAASAAPR